jgi:hypothetical protein
MGSKPNFDPILHLPDPTKHPGHGPEAKGPVGDRESLRWVYVWIFQNGEEKNDEGETVTWAAAADGESPEGSPAAEQWAAATKTGDEWTAETHMMGDSDAFRTDRAATATALALVDRADGTTDAYWWTEAVLLKRADDARRS